MGMFWQYFSFAEARWNAIFGGGMPGAERHVIASAVWDSFLDADLPDPAIDLEAYLDAVNRMAPEPVRRLAKRICTSGISYDGLGREEAAALDSMIVGFFCTEGLETLLEFKIEHWDGLHGNLTADLLSRSKPRGSFFGIGGQKGFPVTLATMFDRGRRIGSHERPTSDGLYFLLSPGEISLALREVEGLLALDRPWRSPEFREEIEKELRGALLKANDGKRCLAGRWT